MHQNLNKWNTSFETSSSQKLTSIRSCHRNG